MAIVKENLKETDAAPTESGLQNANGNMVNIHGTGRKNYVLKINQFC